MTSRLRRAARNLLRRVAELGAVDLALRLTLLDLLLRPVGDRTIRPAVMLLAGAGLLVPGWLRRPGLWWLLALLSAVRVILDWPLPDNHAYLLCYWCLAIALSLLVEDSAGSLASNSRMLIGLVFAFATLWKLVLSPDYLDGTFFRVTLLTDPRFEDFTRWFGAVTPELLESHRTLLEQHVDGAMPGSIDGPVVPQRFLWLARFATVWTLVIEAAVAIAFLWPGTSRLCNARHALLILFCATTYAVAPVEGFGWLLIAMGVAQCEPERRTTRTLYLAAFALILLYRTG